MTYNPAPEASWNPNPRRHQLTRQHRRREDVDRVFRGPVVRTWKRRWMKLEKKMAGRNLLGISGSGRSQQNNRISWVCYYVYGEYTIKGRFTQQFLYSRCVSACTFFYAYYCIFDGFRCIFSPPFFFIPVQDMCVPVRSLMRSGAFLMNFAVFHIGKYSMFYYCGLHWKPRIRALNAT